MDGTQIGSINVAVQKALAALRFKRSTKLFQDMVTTDKPHMAFLPGAVPVDGQRFTFDQFSGEPQIFLTREQLLVEMRVARQRPAVSGVRKALVRFRGDLVHRDFGLIDRRLRRRGEAQGRHGTDRTDRRRRREGVGLCRSSALTGEPLHTGSYRWPPWTKIRK